MTKSAFTGPLIVYGQRNPPGLGVGGTTNADRGPSLFYEGIGLLDARAGYNRTRPGAIGWYGGSGGVCVLDQVPSTLTLTAIAAAQVPVAGTAMTLVTSSAAGITVLASATTIWSSGTSLPAGTLVIDTAPGLLSPYGSLVNPGTNTTTVMFYDPTKALARNIQVRSVGDDSGATFTVRGYDVYGNAMSETITGSAGAPGTAQGKKAFKFVSSVTPAGTLSGSNVSIGQGDVIGFNLRADTVGYVSVWYNNTLATAVTTPFGTASAFVFADTATATATTGDTRGTVYLGTANPSNATRRIQIFMTPNMNAMTAAGGLFGVTQA